jgi:predicted ATPase/class 3 adenylate cyclase
VAGHLPSGTVTFLFTDVEGSTALLTQIGKDAYGDLLAEHHRLIRGAVGDGGGSEVDTQGEAFFAVFPGATDAVTTAARLQHELTSAGLQVRMGIHTGQPSVASTGYVGLDVPRAARIAAAAHGGQTLLSATTRELVEDELPVGVAVRDLGEHRLKDLTRPQRLSQLVIAGLANEFPALRTLENSSTNLPVQATPLIGREREVAAVTALLSRADVRLLTLTGPGGSGKTRLGLQAAAELLEDFQRGVYLVALESVADPEQVLPTIAQTVGVKETSATPIANTLKEFLADKQLLLLLDNVEQLVEAAPQLADLLIAAPQLKLLVTSRTPLHVSGEHEFPVPSLSLPDPSKLPEIASLSRYESVALFLERAQAVKADFAVTDGNAPAITEICVKLDGLPLAIELAAARGKLLSPQALLARLEQRFDLLVGGPRDMPSRQQTLRATIDWSYDLLSPTEQTLFARIAVFAGGFTLEAAEAVSGADGLLAGLSTLIDNNLLRQEEQPGGEPRFTLLETIRAYALERLDELEEREEATSRHADYFCMLAERIYREGWTLVTVDWAAHERELDNVRTALEWLEACDDVERTTRLAANVPFVRLGHLAESWEWCERSLGRLPEVSRPTRLRILRVAAHVAFFRRDLTAARGWAHEALLLSRELGDRLDEGLALWILSTIAAEVGDAYEDLASSAAAIFRELGADVALLALMHDDGLRAIDTGDYPRARAALDASLERARAMSARDEICNDLTDLGVLALYERRFDDALRLFGESLPLARQSSWDILVAWGLWGIGCGLAAAGDLRSAARLFGAAEALHERLGQPIEPWAVRAYAEGSAPVRERLGEDDLAAAWAAGRALNEADAAAYALQTVTEPLPL